MCYRGNRSHVSTLYHARTYTVTIHIACTAYNAFYDHTFKSLCHNYTAGIIGVVIFDKHVLQKKNIKKIIKGL